MMMIYYAMFDYVVGTKMRITLRNSSAEIISFMFFRRLVFSLIDYTPLRGGWKSRWEIISSKDS